MKLRHLNPNSLRGAFGAALRKLDRNAYEQFFAPHQSLGMPSGLADPPRPFVFRLYGPLEVGLNLFTTREPIVDLMASAMAELGEIEGISGTEPISISLVARDRLVRRLRVRFVTPTEIKGADLPHFGAIIRRIRDRVSTLRALYGSGPLEIEFTAFAERADQVIMTHCEIRFVEAKRTSRNTGQRHSIGGFVGQAEYEGNLAEFVPYLEAAQWTGVGRQTVWGKGEITVEEI